MRALVFDGALRVLDRPEPRPSPGEALIAVRRAGICNTDVEIARGYMGFHGVLGHEFVGEVLEVHDEAHRAWVGRRVAGEINLGCGACARCLAGLSRHCKTRTVLGILGRDGALAERVTLPVANLHAVPDALDDDGAVFIEPVAACFEVLEQLKVQPDARVIVLGDGKLGLMLAQVLRATGCDLTLVGKHPRKLALAAATGVNTSHLDDEVSGDADVVVEATGSPAGLDRALSLVRPRGTLVLKSTFHGAPAVNTARIVIDEVCVLGSRCGPFAPAARALAAGRVDPRPLIDATYPLGDAVEAFAHAQRAGVLKVLIDPRG